MSENTENEDVVCGCDGKGEDVICAPCYYDQSYLIRKICSLFTDDYGGKMVHRHARLLNEYLRVASEGILCADLRFVAYTMEFLARGGSGTDSEDKGGCTFRSVEEAAAAALRYETPLRRLLSLCCTPPRQHRPAQAVDSNVHKDMAELFNALGFVVTTVEDEDLVLRATQAIHCLLTKKDCSLDPKIPAYEPVTPPQCCPPTPRCCRTYAPPAPCPPCDPQYIEMIKQEDELCPSVAPRTWVPRSDFMPLQWRVSAAERSFLASNLGSFLEFAPPTIYPSILDLCLLLSSLSLKNSSDLVLAGTLDLVLLRLSPEYPLLLEELDGECRDPCVPLSFYGSESSLLWGCLRAMQVLESPPPPDIPGILMAGNLVPTYWPAPSHRALKCLSNNLHTVVIDADIQSAISVVSLVVMMQHLFPHLPMVESGLAEDVATLAVCSEVNNNESWANAISYEKSKEVFELKRVLLLSISYLARQPDAMEVMLHKGVVPTLLHMIEPRAAEHSSWRPSLAIALEELSLHALTALALTGPQELVYLGVVTHLLLSVEEHSTDPSAEAAVRLRQRFVLLYHLSAAPGAASYKRELLQTGAVDIMLKFCINTLGRDNLLFSDQYVLLLAFLVLEDLCRKNVKETARHGGSIIKLCSRFFKFALGTDSKGVPLPVDDRMVVCAITFLWEAVVCNPKNSETFVQQGNVYKLLDLLQVSGLPVQTVVLGMLVDLLEFGNCLAHCITWRGSQDVRFLSLLMKIWRNEELFIKVNRDSTGCIQDIALPIMGEDMRACVLAEDKDPTATPAISDMYVSARPRIYAIVQLIKHRYKERTELIEEMYHFYTTLRTEDELTMTIADNYLALKLKEVWSEMILDLERKNIVPIPSDFNMMNVLNDKFIERAQDVQEMQNHIIKIMQNKELAEEAAHYQQMEGSSALEQMETLQEMDAIACGSDPAYLRAAKDIEDEHLNTKCVLDTPVLQRTDCVDPLFRLLLHQNCNMRFRRDFAANQK